MRSLPLVVALYLAAPLSEAKSQNIRSIPDAVSRGEGISELAQTESGRLYYSTAARELWMYDRGSKAPTKLRSSIDVWDLSVDRGGTVIAFTKMGEGGKNEFAWTIPLNPRTGLPTGPERRVSTWPGNATRVSADGRWIAFDAYGAPNLPPGDHLVVLPASGGPERVVLSITTGIDNIRWTPDGKTLYFGAGPGQGHSDEPTTIQRVSLSDGKPVLVTRGNSSWPGLSPDGRFIAFRDTGLTRRFVISDATGRRLTALDIPGSFGVATWSWDSKLITNTPSHFRRLHMFSIASKTSRVLIDSLPDLYGPRWSPDGKQISLVRGAGIRTQLAVADINGKIVRTLRRRFAPLWEAPVWSPDGTRFIYHEDNGAAGLGRVIGVDIAAGRDYLLPGSDSVPGRARNPNPRLVWEPGSNSVIYVKSDSVVPGTPNRSVVRAADVSGGFKDLSEQITALAVWPVDKNTIIVRPNIGEPVIARPANASTPSVKLLDGVPGYVAVPSVSADGQWISLRRNPAQYDPFHMTVLDIVHRDGTHHSTFNLPFVVAPGEDNPHFLPGGKEAIIVEHWDAREGHGVHLMSLPSGSLQKLFTVPFDRFPGQVAVSPDGKSILYISNDPVTSSVAEWDLAPLLARAGK